ncbi:MAG: metal ABC transporter ATP-binding protein [Candidatus Methylacidiphilales bacterium]|nr:metal ABC transporter ATP-binding protein [Candidatus Methylacidiphilales bacterium]
MAHLLDIENITVSYNRIPALHHISVQLRCGSCVGLLGPNGAGKTTFIKAIAGLVPLETGRIRLHGQDVRASARTVAYLPQRGGIDWDFPLTVRGLVEMGRYPALGLFGAFTAEDHRIVDDALRVMRLTDYADRHINALSGGQQQRAFLARSWAQQAHVYLLDEPFNGLDKNSQRDLAEALHHLAAGHKLVIVSHHHLETVPEIFDHVVMVNGELVAAGKTSEVFTPEKVAETFSMEVFSEAAAARGGHGHGKGHKHDAGAGPGAVVSSK